MARKKILWLCSWYPNKLEPYNGDFIQRHAIAAALYNDIHVIHVAADPALSHPTEEVLNISEGLTEQIVYYKRPVSVFAKLRNHYSWSKAYKKAIRSYIAANGQPALIHIHVPMMAGMMIRKIRGFCKAPYVITEHWTIYQPGSQVQYIKQSALFKAALRNIIRGSRLLLPVSVNLGETINEQVEKKAFYMVENVADTKLFFYKENILPHDNFRFIHVSNMSYQKNTEAIVRTFIEVHTKSLQTELVLVGAISPRVEMLATKSGLLGTHIFFRGEVSYAEVAVEMQHAHVLVMFSRFENSPCSIIEALCCGLLVICTAVGGVPELLNKENGLLVEPGNEKALFVAMRTVQADYTRYNRKKIAEDAAGKFSYPVIGKKLDVVYTKESMV